MYSLCCSSTKSVTATSDAINACAEYESKQYADIADFTNAAGNKFTTVVSLIDVAIVIAFVAVVDGRPAESVDAQRPKERARNESGGYDESTWSKS